MHCGIAASLPPTSLSSALDDRRELGPVRSLAPVQLRGLRELRTFLGLLPLSLFLLTSCTVGAKSRSPDTSACRVFVIDMPSALSTSCTSLLVLSQHFFRPHGSRQDSQHSRHCAASFIVRPLDTETVLVRFADNGCTIAVSSFRPAAAGVAGTTIANTRSKRFVCDQCEPCPPTSLKRFSFTQTFLVFKH